MSNKNKGRFCTVTHIDQQNLSVVKQNKIKYTFLFCWVSTKSKEIVLKKPNWNIFSKKEWRISLLSCFDIPLSVPFGKVKFPGKSSKDGQIISGKFWVRKKAFNCWHWEIHWAGKLYGPINEQKLLTVQKHLSQVNRQIISKWQNFLESLSVSGIFLAIREKCDWKIFPKNTQLCQIDNKLDV